MTLDEYAAGQANGTIPTHGGLLSNPPTEANWEEWKAEYLRQVDQFAKDYTGRPADEQARQWAPDAYYNWALGKGWVGEKITVDATDMELWIEYLQQQSTITGTDVRQSFDDAQKAGVWSNENRKAYIERKYGKDA